MNRAVLLLVLLLAPAAAQKAEPFRVEEAMSSLPGTLDPHAIFAPGWNRIFRLAYETPLTCDPRSDRLDIVPHLLAELPELSDDGTTMTLRFREGIRFNDDPCFEGGKGRALLARDFIDTIKRHADPSSGSVYWRPYVAGRIVGLDAARAEAEKVGFWDNDVEVAGLAEKSPLVVELHLTRPYPQLLALMTMSWMSIIPREATRRYGSGLASHTVGSGPYRYDREASDPSKMVFTAVEHYWNAAGGGDRPLPRNAGVCFHALADVALQEKRFGLGDLTLLDLSPQNLDRFVTPRGSVRRRGVPRGTRLLRSDGTLLHYLAFNMHNSILGKKRVRQALAMALDRRRYIEDYYKGAAALADHPVSPSLRVGIPDMPWACGKRDLRKAKALLAAAGYPEGEGLPEFVVDMPSDDAFTHVEARIIADSWKKLGVRVQIRHQTWDSFITRIRNGTTEISVNFWFADYPDAENFMLMLLANKAPVKDVNVDAPNTGFWKNAEYDALYERASRLLPGKERGKLYAEMIAILQEECPWIFVAYQSAYTLLAPGVAGLPARSYFSWDYSHLYREAAGR